MIGTLDRRLRDSENNYTNETFWQIHTMFLLVQDGKTEELKQILNIQLELFPETGRISRDKRKQLEYLTVALIVSFMIASIQGGVYPPEANGISDQALSRLNRIHSPTEIPGIVMESALLFCDQQLL